MTKGHISAPSGLVRRVGTPVEQAVQHIEEVVDLGGLLDVAAAGSVQARRGGHWRRKPDPQKKKNQNAAA